MARFNNPVTQYSDGNGDPFAGNQLFFFEPGTTTPKDTFSDSGSSVANANPVIADGDGRIPDIFLSGTYKVVLKDADDVTIWTRDPVGDTTEGQFESWLNDTTYNIPDIVVGSDNNFYTSLTNANQGNDPISSPNDWERIELSNVQSQISGLIPANAADTDHDVTISTGKAFDSSSIEILTLATAITKQIDATWAAGDDAGGLFTGSVATDTTYHLFIIEKDSDSSIDAGFDTSLTAANIPTGYTAFRRIASFLTDGSSNIILFNAYEESGGGVKIEYSDKIEDLNDNTPATSLTAVALSVPSGHKFSVIILGFLKNSAAADINISSFDAAPTAPALNGSNATMHTNSNAQLSNATVEIMTNTSSQIKYESSNASINSFSIFTLSYADSRR